MGGAGSGRAGGWGRPTVRDYWALDIHGLTRDGCLRDGAMFTTTWSRNGAVRASAGGLASANAVVMSYRSTSRASGRGEDISQALPLVETACYFGGARRWFLCPIAGCGRRVAVLYLRDRYFACRHCLNLAYPSQHEDTGDRAYRVMLNISRRLAADRPGSMHAECPPKPSGMHWGTYARLYGRWCEARERFYGDLAGKLGRLG